MSLLLKDQESHPMDQARNQKENQTRDQKENQTRDQKENQTRDQKRNQTRDQKRNQTEDQLKIFTQKLLEKNQEINLISRKNPEHQLKKLVEESQQAIKCLKVFFKKKAQKILDIGSGNGFPGIVFAIQFPQNRFYLCERRRKKAEALKWLVSQCGLSHVQILCQPAESLKADYDMIFSQASMPPHKIEKLLTGLLKKETKAFLWLSKKQLNSFETSFFTEEIRLSYEKSLLKLSQLKEKNNATRQK